MKAILVIDVPNDFNLDGAYSNCIVYEGGKHRMWNRIAYAKPMPRKNYKKFYFGNIDENRFVNGWNACIETILGEENESNISN